MSRVYAEIIVTDTFDDGIADNTLIEIQAYPLRPVPGNAASWQIRWSGDLTAPHRAAAVVHPTRRRYWTSKQRDELL